MILIQNFILILEISEEYQTLILILFCAVIILLCWKKIENDVITTISDNTKKISINKDSFSEKAIYICEIYEKLQSNEETT